MKHALARWLRRAADSLDPPAAAAPGPEPELVTVLRDDSPGPQVRLVTQMIVHMRVAQILERALNRYSPQREYRA